MTHDLNIILLYISKPVKFSDQNYVCISHLTLFCIFNDAVSRSNYT